MKMSHTQPHTMQNQVTGKLSQYLVALTKLRGNCTTKLAAYTIIQEFLRNDTKENIRQLFIGFGLIDSLLIAIDDAVDDESDLGFLDVSLKSLWMLSQLPIGPLQVIITDKVIKRLVNLLDMSTNVYNYSSDFSSKFREVCEKKHLIGKVTTVPVSSDVIERIHKLSKGKLKSLRKLPDCLKYCQLYDTTNSDKDINVSELLVSEKKAWQTPQNETRDSSHANDEESWVDIFVTEMVEGPLFWGHVGMSAIENVRKIQAVLTSQYAAGYLKPIKSKVGSTVCVHTEVEDGSLFFVRAVVLVTGTKRIKAWAMDYGFLLDLPNDRVLLLPEELQTSKYAPQASLCSLAGIQAPPRSLLIPRLSASILTNLCRKSIPACEIVKQTGGLEILEKFLQTCPDLLTLEYVFNTINNIACQRKMSESLAATQLTETILDKIAELSQFPVAAHKEPLKAALGCICNLLFKNADNREKFYQHHGISVILRVLMLQEDTGGEVYVMGLRVFKSFLYHSVSNSEKPSPRKWQQNSKKTNSPKKHSLPKEFAKLLKTTRTRNDGNYVMQREDLPKTTYLSSVRIKEDGYSSDESCHGRYTSVCARSTTVHSEDEAGDETIIRQKTPKDLCSITRDTAAFYSMSSDQPYILGDDVGFESDSVRELRPNKSVTKVSATVIAKHACGMLNSGKGGSIFFGLQAIVQGIQLTRDDRDEFRLGIDRLMCNKLEPCVLHPFYDVIYHSVVTVGDEGKHLMTGDLYVAEIQIRPNPGTFYNLKSTGECYYRFGSTTSLISPQDMRQLIILEDEELYRNEIQELQQEIVKLKTTM